jgi:hypothetical protein
VKTLARLFWYWFSSEIELHNKWYNLLIGHRIYIGNVREKKYIGKLSDGFNLIWLSTRKHVCRVQTADNSHS